MPRNEDPYFSRQANLKLNPNFDPQPQMTEARRIPAVKVPVVIYSKAKVSPPCSAPGYADLACDKVTHIAHIMTRQLSPMAATLKNRLRLCTTHERYFNKVGSREWFHFVKKNYPERFHFVKSKFRFVLKEYNLFMEVAGEY